MTILVQLEGNEILVYMQPIRGMDHKCLCCQQLKQTLAYDFQCQKASDTHNITLIRALIPIRRRVLAIFYIL